MPAPRLTVDTATLIDAIDRTDADAVMLFERAIAGDFDIAFSTRVDLELTKSTPPPWLERYISERPRLGAPGRWGASRWGSGDYWADAPDDPTARHRVDVDHVRAHIRSARDYFVSRDQKQILRARRLGARAVTPRELLLLFPQRDPA